MVVDAPNQPTIKMAPNATQCRRDKKMAHRSEFQLSIDPSIGNTGLVLWCGGRVVKHHTIKTKSKHDLAMRIATLIDGVSIFVGGRNITAIAIEEFQGHRKNGMLNMMKCSAAQGALIAWAYSRTNNVILINKRNESKEVAWNAAFESGLDGIDEHRADAFRLGQLANFHDKG
jgi:hypothetical protein